MCDLEMPKPWPWWREWLFMITYMVVVCTRLLAAMMLLTLYGVVARWWDFELTETGRRLVEGMEVILAGEHVRRG